MDLMSHGRLSPTLFVPCQHPYLDVGFGQLLYGLRDAVLELVLHGGRSQQLETQNTPESDSTLPLGGQGYSLLTHFTVQSLHENLKHLYSY